MPIDKAALVRALIHDLETELALMARLAREAADAATHEENRPEGDKDMRSTEASYIAAGQAGRAKDLERARAALGALALRDGGEDVPVGVGMVVELRSKERQQLYFVVPEGGGRRLSVDGGTVVSTTPSSPLGAAMVGLLVGEEFEVETPQGLRTWEIVSVA